MSEFITPRVIKGFRDYLPRLEIKRQLLTETLKQIFRQYGFVPIDTPALEFTEILLRKSDGETEKQVYSFTDKGGRDIGLRFDLTVPLARFIAEHKDEISFPFKRYHIANVWRGEKPQAGRFREFMQCDFDILGQDNSEADFEILNLIVESFATMGVSQVRIHISHRGLFNRFLEKLNIREKSEDILRTVDKLSKVGNEEVFKLLSELTSCEKAKAILEFICAGTDKTTQTPYPFLKTLENLEAIIGEATSEGERLKEVYALLEAVGKAEAIILDPSITRGLDYYTGIVYETFLTTLPSIGSVCSGGRYNNLTSLYSKEKLPGVGASIGLDRLLAALEELNALPKNQGFTKAVIFYDEKVSNIQRYVLSNFLTKCGIPTEVYAENKKMTVQYSWAESKDIQYGLFLKPESPTTMGSLDEMLNILVTVKDLTTREQKDYTINDLFLKLKGNILDERQKR